MTGGALFYYSLGMTAFGLRSVLTRAFYSLQDTRTPMKNATFAVIVNIVLNISLSQRMGIAGLALATSISDIISALLMLTTLKKRIGPFGLKNITITFVKTAGVSILMGLIAYNSFVFLRPVVGQNLAVVVAIAIGVLTYGMLVLLIGIPEVDRTVKTIKQRIKKRFRCKVVFIQDNCPGFAQGV